MVWYGAAIGEPCSVQSWQTDILGHIRKYVVCILKNKQKNTHWDTTLPIIQLNNLIPLSEL